MLPCMVVGICNHGNSPKYVLDKRSTVINTAITSGLRMVFVCKQCYQLLTLFGVGSDREL